ncbi:CARDB domain-containing protein [Archangium violaceum]|uniref:CARDB domain-containing protein n=1 Tax=Archangium violaceum TaxID=83451 RepID=UPI0036D7A94C
MPADAARPRSSPAALEAGPDLVVTEVRGPASVRIGQSFTATVKVCNQGSATISAWPRLELFLSTNATLTFPDPNTPPGTPAEQVSLGFKDLYLSLGPGQCERHRLSVNATLPPAAQDEGAYYLAAAIDTTHAEQESREDNNVLVGGLMGVGSRADLVVTGVSAPASVKNGDAFTATVKVCNQGTSPATGGGSYPYKDPRVELFLSMDAELTLPEPGSPPPSGPVDQVSLGYVEELGSLQPGQCVTKAISAIATPPPAAQGDGAYYLVAAVDTTRLQQELREDNNVHVGGLLGVGYRSDLVVTEVRGPASVRPWNGFTASVKVCNQGTAQSSAEARVDLFLLADATLPMPAPGEPASPLPIESLELEQPLFPGQCVTKNVPASATPPSESVGDGAYYLAAAVDTAHVEQELREDNNVLVGGLMGVGHRPDLVVTEVKGPSSTRPGQGFMATVKVCNQGTSSTHGYYPQARLALYLSMDTEVTLPDPYLPSGTPRDQEFIGELELDPLYEGQCVTRNVHAYSWPPQAAEGHGAYYLAAAIDTNHVEQELREDNNVLVGGLMGVGYHADLVVTGLSAPPSAGYGQRFAASVQVCNQGTSPTQGYPYYGRPRVELFLSTEAEPLLLDPSMPSPGMPMDDPRPIGYAELDQTLQPGQCVTKTVQAFADPPSTAMEAGAYHLLAAVDTNHAEEELREDNNVHVGGRMGVGHRADLVVTELSGPASLRPGHGFLATAKVCNQGTSSSSSSSRLEIFLSMDTELSLPGPSMPYPGGTADDQASIGYVNLYQSLQPGQCVTKHVPSHPMLPPAAQGPEGVYYLAAAIDTTHTDLELREDNNVFVGGLMGVGHRSDLVVTELRSPASISYGQHFMVSVKVCNQGTTSTQGYSPGARLELFLSTDRELSLPGPSMPYPGMPEEQISIADVQLDALYEGQCVTKSVQAYSSLPPAAQGEGAYYLVAAVDTNHVEPELREDNNVHVGGLVGVGHRADLVVTGLNAPASLTPGQGFTASVKVCNQGTDASGGGAYPSYGTPRVELFLSMDTELSLPDPSMPYPNGPVDDQQSIGWVELNQALYPGQCVTKSVQASAWLPQAAEGEGSYYLAAAVDTNHAEHELREDNNVHVSGPVGVGHRADLVVTGLSAPTSLTPGQGFTASVKVCNQGTSDSSSMARLALFLSTDTELTLPDPYMPFPGMPMDQVIIGSENVDQLVPGQCVTKSMSASATLPPEAQDPGAYHLIAVVDVNQAEQELREDNNIHVGGLVGVGYRPDLVVTELRGPASVWPGQSFTASVRVCNQGTEPLYSSSYYMPRVDLFLSMDTELTLPGPYMPSPGTPMDQAFAGYVELNQSLYPGQCVTKSVDASASLPPGARLDEAYYLVAAADSLQTQEELREDNNVRVGGLVGVGYWPDLVVREVNAPANLEHGQSFTASVEVCNQGTVSTSSGFYSRPRVELFLSMDNELTLPDPYMPSPGTPMDQQSIGYVELDQPLDAGQCMTMNVPATATPPPAAQGDGAYYLVAAVDTLHAQQELREDNNVLVSERMGVGSRPDLVVSGVSAPAHLEPGQSFTASVEVCNQGTTPAINGAPWRRVELFLSMDTELSLPDPSMPSPGTPMDQQSIGYVELDQPLAPGQCVTASVPASTILPPQALANRMYYLVAAIDTTHAEGELREDNNVLVSGLVGVGYRSDLVVTGVNAPAHLEPQQPFTASVTVCNQGTTPTSGSAYSGPRVELFLSMDAELTPPDPSQPSPDMEREQMRVGSVDLNQPLAPGKCVTENVSASAWLPHDAQPDSALYLAAIVDTTHLEEEFREDNNIHVGGLISVGYPLAPRVKTGMH